MRKQYQWVNQQRSLVVAPPSTSPRYWLGRCVRLQIGTKVALWNVDEGKLLKWFVIQSIVATDAFWIESVPNTDADRREWRHLLNQSHQILVHPSDIYTQTEASQVG